MNGLVSARGAGSAALRVALLAAMLMLAAGTSQADQDHGRGSGHGGRTHNGGGDRSYNRGGYRQDGGGGGTYNGRDRKGGGGGGTYNGGGDRKYKGGGGGGGGRTYGGGGGHTYGGGGSYYGGGGRTYGGGGSYYGGGGSYYGGGTRYCGGRRYYGASSYRYARPRTVLTFGIGLGLPYYCPPAYHRYYVEHVQVVSSTSIDVDNYPPAGCYYYDPFCNREFSNLDDYTDHIDAQDHPRTVEIIVRNSGDRIRTLEFVDGAWRVDR